MSFTTELDIYGMTWGELRTFVDLGKHLEDSEPVELAMGDYDESVEGLRISDIPFGGAPDGS